MTLFTVLILNTAFKHTAQKIKKMFLWAVCQLTNVRSHSYLFLSKHAKNLKRAPKTNKCTDQ